MRTTLTIFLLAIFIFTLIGRTANGSVSLFLQQPAPNELAVDDGTFEVSTGSTAGSLTMVNRLTPASYPATLNGVSVFFRSSDGVTMGAPLTLLVGAYSGSDTSFLSGINFQSIPVTVSALGQFNVYTAPNLTINAGDFVVGFRMAHSSAVRPFVIDQTLPRRARSFLCTDDSQSCLNTENIGGVNVRGNLGIRARLASGTTPTTVSTVSAASFTGNELASESIAAGFGANLSTATEAASSLPLPTTLAGVSLKLRDSANREQLASLFFVSPGQLNYLLPPGLANGAANVAVMRGETVLATGTLQVARVAPGLFAANASGQGVAAAVALRRRADGSESFEPVARFDQAQGRFVPVPIDLGPETDQVFLILYGSGFRFRSSLAATAVTIGGVNSEVLFAGDAPGFVGLDQCNVRLSRSLIGRGEVDVVLVVDGKMANNVRIATR